MKKVMIVMLVALMGSIVIAADSQSFEDPPFAAGPWVNADTWALNKGAPQIDNTTASDGSQSVNLTEIGSTDPQSVRHDVDPANWETSNTQYYKYDLKLGTGISTSDMAFNNQLFIGGNWTSSAIYQQAWWNDSESGWHIKVRDRDAGTYTKATPGYFEPDEWFTIAYEFHLDEQGSTTHGNDTYDIYFGPAGGTLTMCRENMNIGQDVDPLNVGGANPFRTTFYATSPDATVHFDNWEYGAGPVPEPMTIALLGLGGLLIRRKK